MIVGTEMKAKNGRINEHDINEMKSRWMKAALERFAEANIAPNRLDAYFEHRSMHTFHDLAIKEGKRVDGRAFDEIRPLFAKAGGISPTFMEPASSTAAKRTY